MTTVTKRCAGHCHCHALPDGVMAPPCCDDCALVAQGAMTVEDAAHAMVVAMQERGLQSIWLDREGHVSYNVHDPMSPLTPVTPADKGRPGYCARCGLGNNNGGVPTEGDSAEVHICPPALVEKALRDAVRIAADVLGEVAHGPHEAEVRRHVQAVRDRIQGLLSGMEAPPRCPKCSGPTFPAKTARGDGRHLFVCADPKCGGAVWVLPAV